MLEVYSGSLYPALHRLKRKNWITAEWTLSEDNPKVKTDQLTVAGKKHLAAEPIEHGEAPEEVGALARFRQG